MQRAGPPAAVEAAAEEDKDEEEEGEEEEEEREEEEFKDMLLPLGVGTKAGGSLSWLEVDAILPCECVIFDHQFMARPGGGAGEQQICEDLIVLERLAEVRDQPLSWRSNLVVDGVDLVVREFRRLPPQRTVVVVVSLPRPHAVGARDPDADAAGRRVTAPLITLSRVGQQMRGAVEFIVGASATGRGSAAALVDWFVRGFDPFSDTAATSTSSTGANATASLTQQHRPGYLGPVNLQAACRAFLRMCKQPPQDENLRNEDHSDREDGDVEWERLRVCCEVQATLHQEQQHRRGPPILLTLGRFACSRFGSSRNNSSRSDLGGVSEFLQHLARRVEEWSGDMSRVLFFSTVALGSDTPEVDTVQVCRAILSTGASLAVDSFDMLDADSTASTREYNPADEQVAAALERLLTEHKEAEDQIMVSSFVHQKIQLVSYGGHGFGHVLRSVENRLRARGVLSDRTLRKLFLTNAARLYAWYMPVARVELPPETRVCSVCSERFVWDKDSFHKFEFVYCSAACLRTHAKAKFNRKVRRTTS